jgi:hypothetical protein
MKIAGVTSAFQTARCLVYRPRWALSRPTESGRSWPKLEQLLWSAQRQQADVHAWGLPTPAVDPNLSFEQLKVNGLDSERRFN